MPNSSQLLNKKLQDRKYFDSGDYALSKAAGKSSSSASPAQGFPGQVGLRHPNPENIPHNFSGLRKNSFANAPGGQNMVRRSSIVTNVMNASDTLTA